MVNRAHLKGQFVIRGEPGDDVTWVNPVWSNPERLTFEASNYTGERTIYTLDYVSIEPEQLRTYTGKNYWPFSGIVATKFP
jgi:hypothetical protein